MENKKERVIGKSWGSRTTSTTSSIIEYVNEAFEDSEIQLSVDSVAIFEEKEKPGIDISNTMEEFSALSSEEGTKLLLLQKPRKMYLASLIVLLFAICMGVAITYTATATEGMRKNRNLNLNDDDITWIGSLLPIGALTGGIAAGYFTNSLGRKGALILNTIPFVIGWILIAYAETIGMLLGGRILVGFSCGIISVATPMYLVEISTPEIRGLLGASFQLFVVIGVLLVSIMGSVLSWRWLAISGGIACLLSATLMIPMPESPRWLVMKKRREEAIKELIYLQGIEFDAKGECEKTEEEIQKQPVGNIQLKELKSVTVRKPFILSILLMFFQQYSGVNMIMFYTGDIFKAAKVKNFMMATIAITAVQVLATVIGTALIDKAGRRILLMASGAGMALSLLLFSSYDFANYQNPTVSEKYGWLPIFCLAAFISSFSIGFGPAPWLMVPEMTPSRFRSIIGGISAAANWAFVFFVTKSYKTLDSAIHGFGMYALYGTICLFSVIFVYIFVPETKGKTMTEIENHFKQKLDWKTILPTRCCAKRQQ